MRSIVVIPARYNSSRLPGKPLVNLCGVPMIVRTWRQCVKAVPARDVYIATDDARIEVVCEEHGAQVIRTSDRCLTGTDRVAEVAEKVAADIYLNVQGDEPVFNPADLSKLIAHAERYPLDIINGYCPITSDDMFRSPMTPKVVMRPDGRLLYMSRAAIPTNKQLGFRAAWRQVCAYAFPGPALAAFAGRMQKTQLEEFEDIEILRFLELGFDVRMIEMSDSSVAVDTPADIMRAEVVINALD